MVKKILQSIGQVLTSRLFIMGAAFVLMFSGLIVRIFYLQIINGESYLNNYLYQAERTLDIPSTRGIIYDCNGIPLAYNELAYAVVIADDGSQNNRELNETIYNTIKMIEKNGDSMLSDFSISLNTNGEFEFATSSDTARLAFLRDVYGKQSIADLDTEEETLSNSTAEEVFLYLCSSRRYHIQNEISAAEMTEEELLELEGQRIYTKDEALKIMVVRYALSSISYRRYVNIKIASDVSPVTVTAIKEHSAELPGVGIEEETIRKYTDSTYFAHIIGYTRKASEEDLERLQALDASYTADDVVGQEGLESYLELELQGQKGSERVYVDSRGTILDVAEVIEPVAGDDIYLTLDAELTKELYDMFENYLAGILLTKIVNRDVNITAEMSASQRYISVKDAYYALLNNNIIDISHFSSEDATETEQEVYRIFTNKLETVIVRVVEELTKDNPAIYSRLDEEYQVYMSYVYTLLEKNGVLVTSKIDASDATYRAWRVEDSISLKEFLLYAISKNWIDNSKLNVESRYSDTEQTYSALMEFIEEKLRRDSGFGKRIYRYIVNDYTLRPTLICRLLFDQNIIAYSEEDYQSLVSGNNTTAYNFLMDKIRNIEITPAQLALDPCSGSVCMVDPNTGDVKALVIYPSYDNNKFSGYIDAAYWNLLANDESNAKPLYNRATMTGTAPGSTFKMISAIAGLEEGVITTTETIRDLVAFDTVPPTLRCWYAASHGLENVTTAIRDSCNYYFYEVGYRLSLNENKVYTQELGIEKLAKYAAMFGFDSRSGIELSEAAPQISTEYPIQSAIGQGNNNFTNVQLARYTATLANRGTNYKLTLLDRRTSSEGEVLERYSAEISNQVEIRASTWEAVHSGMRAAIENGSVKNVFRDLPFTVAGKTGTAQENPYRPNHAVFVGYAPYENPEIAISVLIPNGFTSGYAAGIAKNALEIYYDLDEEGDSAITPDGGGVID